MQSPYMKPKDAAAFLETTAETLEFWRRNKRGPNFIRSGRFIRYHRDDLIAWMQSHREVVS